jgi:small conductance mechanosensitive channel
VATLFWVAASLVRNVLGRALQHTPMHAPIRGLIVNVAGIAVMIAGFFIALGVLGLDKMVTSLLAGVGIVGLALGFAFQDIASNFMAGIILSFRHPFRVGHIIETNGFFGPVESMSLRNTHLRQLSGQTVRIPNKDVLGSPLVNYSEVGERRVELTVGVSYGDDLEQVRRVALTAIEALPMRLAERPTELFFQQFGDSSIDFQVRFWIRYTREPDFLGARSEAVMAIKRAFDQEGITIPFPIRTLDFSTVGGARLDEVLRPVLVEQRGDGRRPGGAGSASANGPPPGGQVGGASQ